MVLNFQRRGKKSADSTPSRFFRTAQKPGSSEQHTTPTNNNNMTACKTPSRLPDANEWKQGQNGPDLSALAAAIDQVADEQKLAAAPAGDHRRPSSSTSATPTLRQSKSVAATPRSKRRKRDAVSAERTTKDIPPLDVDHLRDTLVTPNDRLPRVIFTFEIHVYT